MAKDDSGPDGVLESTLPALRRRHRREESILIRRTLVSHDYYQGRTARALGVPATTLASAIDRLGLRPEVDRNGPGRGNPHDE